MLELLIQFLSEYRKSRIGIDELMRAVPGSTSEVCLRESISLLVQQGLLKPIQSSVVSGGYLTYRIDKRQLQSCFKQEILELQGRACCGVSLSSYLTGPEASWHKDRPILTRILDVLSEEGIPEWEMTPSECSFLLTGDEKWLEAGGGRTVLQKIGLLNGLKLTNHSDPLMLAVNPSSLGKNQHKHLIVENRSTYHALLKNLFQTDFTSLVYGSGWKIVGNLDQLEQQLGIEGQPSSCWYFGDLDNEGISIWHGIQEKAGLATPFYEALLSQKPSGGKHSQRRNDKALEVFLLNFRKEHQEEILNILDNGTYVPQEAISAEVLYDIWRNNRWS